MVAKILEEWASGIKRKAVLLAKSGVEFDELKLRSLGSLKKTVDNNGLVLLAQEHRLSHDEIYENVIFYRAIPGFRLPSGRNSRRHRNRRGGRRYHRT